LNVKERKVGNRKHGILIKWGGFPHESKKKNQSFCLKEKGGSGAQGKKKKKDRAADLNRPKAYREA